MTKTMGQSTDRLYFRVTESAESVLSAGILRNRCDDRSVVRPYTNRNVIALWKKE